MEAKKGAESKANRRRGRKREKEKLDFSECTASKSKWRSSVFVEEVRQIPP